MLLPLLYRSDVEHPGQTARYEYVDRLERKRSKQTEFSRRCFNKRIFFWLRVSTPWGVFGL